jgi:hypothetical protein
MHSAELSVKIGSSRGSLAIPYGILEQGGKKLHLCIEHHLRHARGPQHSVGLLIGLLCCLWICLKVLYDFLRHSWIQVGRDGDRYLQQESAF